MKGLGKIVQNDVKRPENDSITPKNVIIIPEKDAMVTVIYGYTDLSAGTTYTRHTIIPEHYA